MKTLFLLFLAVALFSAEHDDVLGKWVIDNDATIAFAQEHLKSLPEDGEMYKIYSGMAEGLQARPTTSDIIMYEFLKTSVAATLNGKRMVGNYDSITPENGRLLLNFTIQEGDFKAAIALSFQKRTDGKLIMTNHKGGKSVDMVVVKAD